MYPELKIKNCKKKSSTCVFYFYSPNNTQLPANLKPHKTHERLKEIVSPGL
jgi:hypothetical protein